MRRGDWADPQSGRITLAAWHTKWSKTRIIERATADKYASHWRTHVEPRWGNVKLMAITAWDVDAWVADMARAKVGATTANQSIRLLRHMLSDAARHRLIKADPTTNARLPKIPKHVDRFLSLAEYDALQAALSTDVDRCIVRLMAFAGLRFSEVAGLHSHRVDLQRERLIVVETLRRDGSIKGSPKSAAGQRFVPLGAELSAMLMPLLSEQGLVFPGLTYTNWRRRVFVPAVEAAGLALPYPTPHDLRHTFGSWLAEANVSPTDIMALMGHSTLRATERYLHSSDSRFERARLALATPVLEIKS